ncbi:MAG: GIY-YIG nuclease family protein [Candidatus Promineifilaceae bacterium]
MSTRTSLPSAPGVYALVLHLPEDANIVIGKLGEFNFPPGFYLYIGSAFGPGGLASRLKRHGRSTDDPEWKDHWHIDYLRHYTNTREIWLVQNSARSECDWASMIGMHEEAFIPASKFGATDCTCRSHLFHFEFPPDPRMLLPLLTDLSPGDALEVYSPPYIDS